MIIVINHHQYILVLVEKKNHHITSSQWPVGNIGIKKMAEKKGPAAGKKQESMQGGTSRYRKRKDDVLERQQ
jgi:hypothetical protein